MASLKSLEFMATSLKGHVTPAIVDLLDKTLQEAREKWEELETGTETRKEGMYASWGLAYQIGCLTTMASCPSPQPSLHWWTVYVTTTPPAPRWGRGLRRERRSLRRVGRLVPTWTAAWSRQSSWR